ncbi:MAG: Rieske 2Fe-2S domain-containing protein [Nitrososphaerota archaeon]|nr:Rieske 2Fe-2S domain-containing protein [Nitrososphaerota archaeon]MDG6943139.1 Rieske 2Fe-2S domain-containing protein [Nitrososphaerota archaeon]MDG6950983.1 Rieske 2Fe-2S domain-containing protein [Nitrososphaerota archaeon]
MDEPAEKKETPPNDGGKDSLTGRRDFLRVVVTVGAVGTIVGVAGLFTEFLTYIPAANVTLAWPKALIANINDLQDLKPVNFFYPLSNEPNVLVKLGVKAENGIGPGEDVVAFSLICQHLGCIYAFVPEGSSPVCNSSYKMPVDGGYCCCHGSHYDFTKEGAVIGGPAPRPVPMVQLELDQSTGDIYATSMGPPSIFGHNTGATAPAQVLAADMTGGTVITNTVAVTSTQAASSTSTSSGA